MTTPSVGRRDLAVTLIALALLLAWDAVGWDLATARWFANAQGFAWRDNWWASHLAHDGGRLAAWVLLALVVVAAVRPPAGGPGRAERLWWTATMLICVVTVPMIKLFSRTSCPWDLAEFGGAARYVSHWAWGVADGGAGHCFPSGHAVAGFAFIGMYFLWRNQRPQRARLWLAGVVAAGALFGAAQLVRGAHYPSHTLWSAWLCWALCVASAAIRRRRVLPSPLPGAAP
jgi:membrane-associated PAP2 superfamily phosphatase